MKKIALMVSQNAFPNGDAGSVRDLCFAKIYKELGFTPVAVCRNKTETSGEYEGVRFFSLYSEADSALKQARRYMRYGSDLRKLVSENILTEGAELGLVHLYDAPESGIKYLYSLAGENVPFVHDSVEWYSPCEFRRGKLDKSYILKNRLNTKLIRKPARVIGISSFLTEHFKERGLRAVRIPVIMDVKGVPRRARRNEGPVRLVYAGSPAKKDRLREMLLGFLEADESVRQGFELHIIGVTAEQAASLAEGRALPGNVFAYGRIPRPEVEGKLLEMDFSLLLRPAEERYAKAGFPTKSVEAMSHGAAMICNISSDLGMYLKDGENAVICRSHTKEAFTEAMTRLAGAGREEIERIKSNAAKTAEENFDYRLFIGSVAELLDE